MFLALLVVGAVGSLIWVSAAPEQEPTAEETPLEPGDEARDGPDTQSNDAEAAIDHYLTFGVASLGAAALGALMFPPISLLSGAATMYTAIPIYRSAYRALCEERRMRASVLDSVAITGAILTQYFFAGALSSVFYYAGRKLLHRTEDRVKQRLTDVFGEQPHTVWIAEDGIEIEVPFAQVQAGDIIVVNTGQSVPVDGIICEGVASIDQHRLTGESQPLEVGAGAVVLATSVVLTGRICIEATRTGLFTVASQIGTILSQTADYRATLETRGERVADQTALPIMGLGTLALATMGTRSAVAVLFSNFFDNMRVAGPLSMLNYLDVATRRGVLVKDGRALEVLNDVDTVIFDKTGTLTTEQPELREVHTIGGMDAETLLIYAAAVEARQSHPIARAITQAAQARSLTLPVLDDACYQVGYGISAALEDRWIQVGSARFMAGEGIVIPDALHDIQANADGFASLVYVAVDGVLGGVLELRPTPRPEVRQVLAELRARGLSLYIMSGDHESPTRALAMELGIEKYFAGMLPQQKASMIERLQGEGRKVCFVGDGINDAIALKKAHSSISLSGATTVAIDTAQIVLLNGTLSQLPSVFQLVEDFSTNVRTSYVINGSAEAVAIAGVFVLNASVYLSVALYNLSLIASLWNSMRPASESADDPSGTPVTSQWKRAWQ